MIPEPVSLTTKRLYFQWSTDSDVQLFVQGNKNSKS